MARAGTRGVYGRNILLDVTRPKETSFLRTSHYFHCYPLTVGYTRQSIFAVSPRQIDTNDN